ncbi:putative TetR family transcriptional regulator [Gordonia hirsuta DSM 44140 = NBRC 16056]|uniref:Putative TetR family transcriptional regulator n=1 Tax=Gordonia hirsuta DSM 44140 = NBRC 16056 TaxID=1121927 RepID=L7L9Z5_9ACTN|nr:TetR/AcrR family transcriptional regulator [Gordonia hirsuta]GAC57749.1 putative TetR family transcriptional regulator [Gordonia hirsuta DSM 44140 = NBRC 16056]
MAKAKERVYGGVSASERREQRRASLIEAGLELFGTLGYPNVPVKRICDEAGLTQRYFYESFSDREALLDAVYRSCVEALRTATATAAADYLAGVPDAVDGGAVAPEHVPGLARAAFSGFLDTLTVDPRRARIILIEVVGVSPALEQLRLGAIHDWADLILVFASGQVEPSPHHRLAAIGLVGAFTQLLVDWQMAAADPVSERSGPGLFTVEAIKDVITEMLVGTYEHVFRGR